MANSGSFRSSYYGNACLEFAWQIQSQDIANNSTTVYFQLRCVKGDSGYYTSGNFMISIDGTPYWSSATRINIANGTVIHDGTFTLTHNADGTRNFNIYIEGGIYTIAVNVSGTSDFSLNAIPRYANITSFTVSKVSGSTTSLKFNYTVDAACDWAWYSINNGSSWNNLPANGTVTGLTAGTSYNCKLRVRRTDSQLTTDSSKVTQSTYPNTVPTISLSSKTVNSITVTSGCNVSVSSTQYRIKKGSGSYGSYQNSATFTGLTPNSTYTIEVKKVSSSGSITGTKTLSVTTYNIATISSYPNFNHGDTETITYSNPSGATTQIAIYDTAGSVAYAAYRNCSGGSYTFNFTDTELDNIYKAYGNNATLNVKCYLRTTASSTNYYDSKQITITFKGNQKTVYINDNGTWKRCKRWVNVSGTWKRAVRWVNVNGTWKRCI